MAINEEDLIVGEYYIDEDYGICQLKDIREDNEENKKYYGFKLRESLLHYREYNDLKKISKCVSHFLARYGLGSLKNRARWIGVRDKVFNEIKCEELTKEALAKIEEYKNILNQGLRNLIYLETDKSKEINEYVEYILEKSFYPKDYIKNIDIEYVSDTKTIIIDYKMPNTVEVPNVLGYKNSKNSNEIVEVKMKDREFNSYYESIIFQITLRTIKEIFSVTKNDEIETIVFNGWTKAIDKRTGTEFTAYIISLMVSRFEFEKISLEQVSYKDCILYLKGIFAGKLHQLAPVKPILNINKDDKRFIEGKEVLSQLDEGVNLAEMDWEDFEYLIRELFGKIFSNDGSEVKVTQASRDGGVDAIAFDNDPIRGGKFIIQAKRYNNVVPVSAVRDLYGTVINEGAVKGILVTTSYFGNDSREFIKDKPITLLEGSNIVYLLNKYGYKTHIKLMEKTKYIN